MKRKLLFIITFSFFSFAHAQEEVSVVDSYTNYFDLPRESLFLHTNKTTYIPGEEIWFKIYAYDRENNLTSKATTNIYVGIYGGSGEQIDKKLFLAKEGLAQGNISIDSTFTTGDYYLKVSTNWMKNFKENDAFIQKIKIINPDSEEITSKKINATEYDVQFLPEGGHLLSDVKNNIGVKAIDDKGKGTVSEGIIFDSKGEKVADFKSNVFGIGKFTFTPIRGESYTAKIKLSNYKEFQQELPLSKNIGIAMNVNNLKTDQVIINFSLNEESLELFKNEKYEVLIHKDGLAKRIPFIIDNKTERITIHKAILFKGVNTITLFNEKKQPILERMFFNDMAIENHSIAIKRKQATADSITYQLTSGLKQNQLLNVSISVLPKETISYKPNDNIISAFYLKPYLKTPIENPQYYFQDQNRKRKYELDVLLLTQGWSRYSWDNIMNFRKKQNFDFENGISINGVLNTNIKKTKSLLLYPTKLNKSTFIPIDKDGKFHIKNFYPIVGEEMKFSYINKKQKTKKPNIALSFIKHMDQDFIDARQFQSFESFYKEKNDINDILIIKGREQLDEIVIDAKLLEKAKRRKYRLPFRGKIKTVTKKDVEQFNSLGDFLNNNGFVVLQDPSTGLYSITSIKSSRDPVVMYLNNSEIKYVTTLLDRPTASFEDIYIDNNSTANNLGLSGDGFGFAHVIKVFSRRNSLYQRDKSKDYQRMIKVVYGFEPQKEFYTPKYATYMSESFNEFGIIHWEPSITIRKDETSTIKTINTRLDEVTFYIEGITSKGDLISQKNTLNSKKTE
jgi:hypothetical protein